MAYTWEKRWHSGEVSVFIRYDDDTSEWVVRAAYQTNVAIAIVRVPDTDWCQLTSQPVNTNHAFMYAAIRGMNVIVSDNETIRDNCSFANAHSVHVSNTFKNAWSDYDRDNMSRR